MESDLESDLEEFEKLNLDITKLGIFNYKINEENKKLFLEKTAEEVRPIMKFILDITIHVSYETFVKKIKENLIKLLKEHYKTNNTIFVFLNRFEYKSKSNYWMYKYILYFLKNIQEDVKIIFTLEEEEINDNDIILLIDDCIYSGEQMSSTIEKITDYYEKIKKVKLILFVPYISKRGIKWINDSYTKNTFLKECVFIISDHEVIEPLTYYLLREDINNLFKYSKKDLYNLVEYYNQYDINRYAIYFDHKLADDVSTFPIIYNGIVPNEKNLNLLKKEIRDITQYDYFPLITNCENKDMLPDFLFSHYITNNNCPYSPYKEDYNKNLEKIKTGVKYYLKEEPIKIENLEYV